MIMEGIHEFYDSSATWPLDSFYLWYPMTQKVKNKNKPKKSFLSISTTVVGDALRNQKYKVLLHRNLPNMKEQCNIMFKKWLAIPHGTDQWEIRFLRNPCVGFVSD